MLFTIKEKNVTKTGPGQFDRIYTHLSLVTARDRKSLNEIQIIAGSVFLLIGNDHLHMGTDERPTKRYQFAPRIQLPAVLATLGIETLEVSTERAIAIDDRTILDFAVVEGTLSDARTVEIGVIDQPDSSVGPLAHIESVRDRLRTARKTTTDRGSADRSNMNVP